MMAVLREAGVVDAGGKGFVRMLEGVLRLIEGGFLKLDVGGLRATAEGRQRLNAMLPVLLDRKAD